jgi:hypothetical protein
VEIASKLPVADLLPMLAKPRFPQRTRPAELVTLKGWRHPDRQAAPFSENRMVIELEAENLRLRETIAQLSGSLLAQRQNGCAKS